MKLRVVFFIGVFVAVLAGAVYISAITLPLKVSAFVASEIEKATGKKLFFQSLRLDPVKGLSLERPVLYDDTAVIVRAKKARARFFIMPAMMNKIVIPAVVVESPSILLERRADNSFNIQDIFSAEYLSEKGAALAIHKVLLRDGTVNFINRALPSPFTKKIENINIDIMLALPARINFKAVCEIPSDPHAIHITSSGRYSLYNRELYADITIKRLSLDGFRDYYSSSGFSFSKGAVDTDIGLKIKDGVINAEINGTADRLAVSRDDMDATLDTSIKMFVQYDTKDKDLEYAGSLDIRAMDIDAKGDIGEIKNIKAKVEFNDSRLSSEDLTAEAFGIPWKAKINLVNFSKPIFDIYAATETDLKVIKRILDDNFDIELPMDIAGKSDVELAVQFESDKEPKVNGYIRMRDATINPGSSNRAIEHITGEAKFSPDRLTWSGLDIAYRNTPYKTSGVLTNFEAPGIQINISSKDLSIESIFAVNDETIRLSKLSGKYLNSTFNLTGEVYMREEDILDADVKGSLYFNLKDLKGLVKDSPWLDKMKLAGRVSAEFALTGYLEDIKRCGISAKIGSDSISLYDLRLDNISMDYLQKNGEGHIKTMKSLFYNGSLWSTWNIDWLSKEMPYHADLNIKNVKLERLKRDTVIRDKDVSGNINLNAAINGSFKETTPVTGAGRIDIAKGKLWQLNLFKGLGMLIFTSDFSNVVFTEGSCNFKIENEVFSTTDLKLTSDLINIDGRGRIGFDKSVKAVLKSELTGEAMEPSFKKNIATMIERYTSIDITGTVGDPRYAVKTSPSDIIKGFARTYFEQ